MLEKKVNTTPVDYTALNQLYQDFPTRFVPQTELSAEQAFWSQNSVTSLEPNHSSRPAIVEVLNELPKVSMLNTSLKKLKHHLAGFDVVVKERTTPTAITEGSWGFEHTKACFRDEIIPFVKVLKDLFNTFNQYLVDELSEVQNVFNQMEQAVEQHRLESKTFEVKMNQVLNENERLLEQVLSKDIVNILVNSSVYNASLNVHECEKCLKLEIELQKDFVEKEIYAAEANLGLDRSMDFDKYLEGQSMQRPPLFESDSFIYWKNRFETYVKSKDLDLWHVITNGDFQPIIQNLETKLNEVVPFEKQTDDPKRRLAKDNEAKMVIYNALPRKEYENDFMALHPKWRARSQRIEESKDLTSLSLRKSLALKAKKESSDEECLTSGSEDEEYAMARSEKNDEKIQDETCLVAQAPNEVCSESSYFSDENSSIDDLALDNEYDKLCKMSLMIITKNKRLKAIRK
ncbi:hypothetical protein Tco_0268348 [Tanacetum coccineum]